MSDDATREPAGSPPATGEVRVLLRLTGEMSTKSRRTRARFLARLADNIRDALEGEGLDARLEEGWSRLYVEGEDTELPVLLGRIFGISSLSRIEGSCEAELGAIVERGRALFADRVRGRRYAVRARRSGRHDFGSRDVERELGAALNPGARVDLENPEVTVRVEVRDDRAHLFSDRRPGAGGLPLGVQGSALALLSGGYDSAVAAWMALRRGVALDYLFCNLGGEAYLRMVLEVAKVLSDRWSYGTRPRLHVVDFSEPVRAMREAVHPAYLQVVLKRLMYAAGTRVARETGALALVTGESVGQVSSQTLANLAAIHDASPLPVLRPLIGFEKEEIVARARRIGTHDLSARVREYCALGAHRPVTAADPARVRREADAVDPEPVTSAVDDRRVLDLRALDRTDVVTPRLFVTEIPEEAVVIDAREASLYERWHWPGARHWDFDALADGFRRLEREPTYVLYCEEGTKTAHLVERMQAKGYEAYSVRGGVRTLRRRAEVEAEAEPKVGAEAQADAEAEVHAETKADAEAGA